MEHQRDADNGTPSRQLHYASGKNGGDTVANAEADHHEADVAYPPSARYEGLETERLVIVMR